MRKTTHALICFIALNFAATAGVAACFADYKAKQVDPLRLHYGVAEVKGSCTPSDARAELSGRLASQGWTLLNILSVFDESGLAQRKDSAGSNYLRF
jgi:hypothetical protein